MPSDNSRRREDPPAQKPGAGRVRRPWVRPAIEDFGSTRQLVRAATGPLGDPGTAIGKRTP